VQFHKDQQELFFQVLSQMARKNNKSVDRIQRLLLVKRNNAFVRQFWQTLEGLFPGHPYTSITRCQECGTFELCEPFPD